MAINGQTGKIAIDTQKKKVEKPWIYEPTFITLSIWLIAVLSFILSDPHKFSTWREKLLAFFYILHLEFPVIILVLFTAIIAFSAYSHGKEPLITNIFLKNEDTYQRAQDTKLLEKKEISLKEDIQDPVFYDDYKGEYMPVDIRFHPPIHTVKCVLLLIVFIWLPSIVALPLFPIFNRGVPFTAVFNSFFYMAGGAWLIFALPVAFVVWTRIIRQDLLGIYYVRPYGTKKRYEMVTKYFQWSNLITNSDLRKEDMNKSLKILAAIVFFLFLGSLLAIIVI